MLQTHKLSGNFTNDARCGSLTMSCCWIVANVIDMKVQWQCSNAFFKGYLLGIINNKMNQFLN